MSWRTVIISKRAKLDLQLGYMVVRGEDVTKVFLKEISTVILESTEISLTAALMAALVENKIKVVLCDAKRNPCGEVLAYYAAHDSSAKIRQQVLWKDKQKGEVGTAIIRHKIIMQARHLKLQGREACDMLFGYAEATEFRDQTNREGHAAKLYFNSLFGNGFSRTDINNINAALNYGYTVLLSVCNREISANGYITQLGFIHDNIFNPFNLSSDIMEPLRPFVDQCVLGLLNADALELFDAEAKHSVLKFLEQQVLVEGKKYYLDYAIKVYVRSVFDAINDADVSKIKWCDFCELK